jgi:hypothetical protein
MKTHLRFIVALLIATTATGAFSAENPIVRENRKEGSTNWLLFNYDQVIAPGRDDLWKREKGIEGYCSQASIKAGETLKVFVSTEPASSFKIDFYRMGYYGGKGGRLLHSTGGLAGKTQPTPDDGKKALIECKWDVSYELKIPQDWPSGVYLGKLQVATPKAEAYVIFIVRDERKADLLFQCSDMTWQSYNPLARVAQSVRLPEQQVAHERRR